MSLLNANQRAVIRVQTGIDPFIIDRATDAFDALIERNDVQAFGRFMSTAWVQMGFGPQNPVTPEDRPTALDKIKTILIRAYAERERIGFQQAANRITRMLEMGG
jgi:hypothetical protein